MTKKCTKCGEAKDISHYSNHKISPDGKSYWCRECWAIEARKYRAKNREHLRQYGRKQRLIPHIGKKLRERGLRRRQQPDYLRKERASHLVSGAIKRGELKRLPCERCGEVKTEGHHSDYKKPLSVIWLCHVCHKEEHKRIKLYRKVGE